MMLIHKLLIQRWRIFIQLVCVGLVLAIALQVGRVGALTAPQNSASQGELLSNPSHMEERPIDLMQQGETQFQAGRYLDAITLWQQAATQFEAVDDRLNQARALSAIAMAFEALSEWKQATTTIEQAIALLNALEPTLDGTQLLAQALNTQGNLQLNQGQESNALDTWQHAEAVYELADDPVGVVGSQMNQARAMQSLGLYRQALTLLLQAEQALMQQPNSSLKVSVLWELGNVLRLVGDLNHADEVLHESLRLAEQLHGLGLVSAEESAATISGILLSSGNLARAQSDFNHARSLYQQAISAAPSIPLAVQAQVVQFSLLVELTHWSDAEALWSQIQPQLAALPPNPTTISIQINAAQSLMRWQRGENSSSTPLSLFPSTETIAQLFATAIQQSRKLGDRRAESYAIGNLGHLYEEAAQWREAQQLTQEALLIAQTIDAPEIAYLWHWQMGQLLEAQEKAIASELPNEILDQAIAAYTEAIEILQSLRSDLVSINSNVQFSFRESVEPVYRQLVELLLRSPPSSEPSQAHLKQARQVIEALQLAELDNFFREACLNASPVQVDQVDPTAAVIYPIILPDQLAVILSLPNQPLHYYKTDLSQVEVERLLNQMRQSLRPNSFLEDRLPVAQQIYDLLIRPSETALLSSGVSTLVFVPDGSLRDLPMAALHDGQHYLIEQYSIALTPGLQLLQPQPLQQQRLRVLIAGLSQTRQGFPALPNVAFEVEQIESEIAAQVLLNQSFTNSLFQKRISSSSASIVHLATHGQFSSNADNTFILTWDDRINVRQLSQILQTRSGNLNPIELLVLSACQTATGDRRAALGMAGVAVRSGARSTLATLWSVSDRSTALFMSQFYQELDQPGVTKVEAVRHAQLTLLQQSEYQSPFYWAPFVLLGNWL